MPEKIRRAWNPLGGLQRLQTTEAVAGRFPKLKGETFMKRTVVRYRTRPELAAENQRLIENVFLELGARSPDGLRYAVLRLADDTFLHVVESEGERSLLPELEAFKVFSGTIRERCLEPPQFFDAVIVGLYRMIGEGRTP